MSGHGHEVSPQSAVITYLNKKKISIYSIFHFFFRYFFLFKYQRKNGNQHKRKTPIIIPSVRAALCSALQPFVGRIVELPVNWKKKFN